MSLRPDEVFVLDRLVSHFGGSSSASWHEGEDLPDAYLTVKERTAWERWKHDHFTVVRSFVMSHDQTSCGAVATSSGRTCFGCESWLRRSRTSARSASTRYIMRSEPG